MNIRKNIEFSTVPFVIITANMDDEVKYRQLENGVNDYIMKPFQTKELIFKIRNLLQFKKNIEKKIKPDPFSKVSIRLSRIDFLSSINDILLKDMKSKIGVDEYGKKSLPYFKRICRAATSNLVDSFEFSGIVIPLLVSGS